ncbi:hypothetical protein AGMMS50276_15420 [Synergistales bacterium]|nr:hypothetical protein AGMMS50276_15420 [Synergistales bacterium]
MNLHKLAQSLKKFDAALVFVETNIAIICYAFMIVTVLFGVVMRFLLRAPNLYGEELAMHFMFASTMFGISMGIRARSHLGVEMLVARFPASAKKWILKIVSCFVAVFYAFLASLTFLLAYQSSMFRQSTPAIHLPYFYIYIFMGMLLSICAVKCLILFINDFVLLERVLTEKSGGIIE